MKESIEIRIFQPHLIRLAWLAIAIIAFVITELSRFRLRPYIQSHDLHDFGYTGSIGNGGGILVQIFLAMAFFNPTRRLSYWFAALSIVGFILYEFLQPVLPKGVFDWNDVLATLIGGGIAVVLLWQTWKWSPNR